MIRIEYLRFLQTLTNEEPPNDVGKIANIVLQHLDELIPLSTTQGQRAKKMVMLMRKNWDSTSTNIQATPNQIAELIPKITQLKSLSVGPFRGFAKQENFDLDSRLVLSYGPNGTGKSSFCEALEYSLLGNVAAASSKRFHNQDDYLKNAHYKAFTPPNLIGTNKQGENVPIIANESIYRFCFVEKTRIEGFSQIAAQTPAKQTELISTLFGLDAFNEFVRNFTEEIDDRYIDIEGTKAKELHEKRLKLAGFQQQSDTNSNKLETLIKEEMELANQYREGYTFFQMINELNGDQKKPGLIKKLDTELQSPIKTKSNLTNEALQMLKQSITVNLTEFNTKQKEQTNASQQLSFKRLYEAVNQVQKSSPDYCPACQTPLVQVTTNPYARAGKELQKLQHLSELEAIINKLSREIKQSLDKLSEIINKCCHHFSTNNQLSTFQAPSEESANIEWWTSLHQQQENKLTPWHHLTMQVKELEKNDKEIDTLAQQRIEKQIELKRLREFEKKITDLQARKKTANDAITEAKNANDTFDTENARLIAEVENEKPIVLINKQIANAYTIFVQKLNSYKNSLPAQLVADLGETVVMFYNALNRFDAKHEQLAIVHLPLHQNQKLEISFQNRPETFFDALHILSEGHIRCIGLAILLAKNIKENCPFLIFDDPVNAIDDEHREAIRKTLFEDKCLANKQIIITCHGEEFFKDIHNLLPANQASQSKSFTFLPKLSDDQHIRIDFNCAPRNYIIAAKKHYENNEIRDALIKSRLALESLTKGKVWSYARKYGDANLSIKMHSATSPIELRNLTEQLKIKIEKPYFIASNKNTILEPIKKLLGLDGNSREWRYLNKGTHDEKDRTEFNQYTVKQIINILENLDAALSCK